VQNDWPGRSHAEQTRQWPIIAHVGERIASMPEFDGLLLVGSFASGTTDDLSDVDFICVAADRQYEAAWARRAELETPNPLFVWDLVVDRTVDEGGHKWITHDLVKVECGIVDPARGDTQLAPPYAVVVGDPSIAQRFRPLDPIPLEVLEAYAQKLRDEGLVPEVESRYGELKAAIRAARSKR
jgi:Nucleotidyltransferase domain